MRPELRAAAGLLFDDLGPVDVEGLDTGELLAILRRNRVPLAELPDTPTLGSLAGKPAFAAALEEERARRETAYREFVTVFEAWRSAGVDCVLIKSHGHFPYTSDNVDVLVHSRQESAACKTLLDLGYIELRYIREPHKKLFRKTQAPNAWYAIHVHTRVEWVNVFLTDDDVLDSPRQSPHAAAVVYPAADAGLLITTGHWLYEDKEMTLRDIFYTTRLLREEIDWEKVVRKSAERGWEGGLKFGLLLHKHAEEALKGPSAPTRLPAALEQARLPKGAGRYLQRLYGREVTMPLVLSKFYCKGLAFRKTAADPSLSWSAKLAEIALLLKYIVRLKIKRLRRRRFTVVALSGPGLGGPVPLVSDIRRALELLEVPFRHRRLGVGPSNVRSQRPLGYALGAGFVVRAWLQWLWGFVRGGVWLFDRYAVDAIADLELDGGLASARWVADLAPSPDLGVLVWPAGGGPPEDRSADGSDGHKRSFGIYRSYASRFQFEVRAGGPTQEMTDRLVLDIIKRHLRDDR